MQDIKFGTDGWRALIADRFTTQNVNRISVGVCNWLRKNGLNKIVIGHDTRFGGPLFCETASRVFAHHNIEVYIDNKVVTTPMISWAAKYLPTDLGIMITASHNPPSYNGYKIKGSFGGPAGQEVLKEIESLIPDDPIDLTSSYDSFLQNGTIKSVDLEKRYLNMLREHFDLHKLTKNSHKIAYDSMFGAGQHLMMQLFPDAQHIHPSINPGFEGISPEPIGKNLDALERAMQSGKYLIGVANDGDADRIGLYDEKGNFVDSHHILLLLLYYLVEYKNQKGKVVASAAVTEKLEKLSQEYGLPFEYTKIGFKHITPLMLTQDVLLAGEEAGGMAIRSHLPERDGIFIALLMLEMMQTTGKSLHELIQLIYRKVGPFAYDRIDLKLDQEHKEMVEKQCENDEINVLDGDKIQKISRVDGYRYYLRDDKWLMIRASGTEPVLRFYAQAANRKELSSLLQNSIKELTGITVK